MPSEQARRAIHKTLDEGGFLVDGWKYYHSAEGVFLTHREYAQLQRASRQPEPPREHIVVASTGGYRCTSCGQVWPATQNGKANAAAHERGALSTPADAPEEKK